MAYDPTSKLANELEISEKRIAAVLSLLDDGNTIPFIARYRKEVTGSLDEVQVRKIKERSEYLKNLEDRRQTILTSIESQGKLTDELRKKIQSCTVKTTLEDLYLPYKPKRRTKATIAREKGLEPLAQMIIEQALESSPEEEARSFINEEKGVKDTKEALEGARHIVAEWISENADVRSFIRKTFFKEGILVSKAHKDFEEKKTKFEQYYNFSEAIKKIPSHRFLAIRRGENESILSMSIEVHEQELLQEISTLVKFNEKSPFSQQLTLSINDSYKRMIAPKVESDICADLKIQSDEKAIEIFAQNLRNLLLSPPMGSHDVIGIDPGLRTGCKCAALSMTGKYLENTTLFLTKGPASIEKAKLNLLAFIKKFSPSAIAIGNGTASRETEAFVKETLKEAKIDNIIVVQVSESGASIYSASDIAREEFPNLDLTIRGAISIARRLQDPLAELVKIEPKSLGVGQYQHDVSQALLEQKLNDVVESCVNHVGVDLNTASAALLSYVAGIGPSLSKKIVSYRDENSTFKSRKQLLKVPTLGTKAFEQAAGFLRIQNSENPLDSSAVHPERYSLVSQMAQNQNISLKELVGDSKYADAITIESYINDEIGEETLQDIIKELKKPGRDPRKSFEMPKFREDVTKAEDLQKGMVIEGIVTNVTAFGAFVDIGVHQDGLVHISQLSNQFVKNPNDVVKTGDKLKVEILDVDLNLKRISLSAKIANSPRMIPKKKRTPKPKPSEKFSYNPFDKL